jgi:peptidoglycan/LPS O-acetylase OafA/YrhL
VTAARAPAAVLTAALVLAGLWFWAGEVAPGPRSALALGVLWCFAAGALAARAGRRLPALRRTLRATVVGCSALAAAAALVTTQRETRVDERVVLGTPAGELAPADVREAVGADPLAPQP